MIWRRVPNILVLRPWDLEVIAAASVSDLGWGLRTEQSRAGLCLYGGYTLVGMVLSVFATAFRIQTSDCAKIIKLSFKCRVRY